MDQGDTRARARPRRADTTRRDLGIQITLIMEAALALLLILGILVTLQ